MISLDSGLTIHLQLAGKGHHRAVISSHRPVDIARLFVGKTPEQLQASLPRLFSVCGVAQACAVSRACALARGEELAPTRLAAQDRLVGAEMLREHVLRVLIGWSKALGLPLASAAARLAVGFVAQQRHSLFGSSEPFSRGAAPASDEVAAARQVAILREALECEVFGESLEMFLGRGDLEAIAGWSAGADTPAAHLVGRVIDNGWSAEGACTTAPLPAGSAAQLAERLTAADAGSFIARPTLDGAACETTALTRQMRQPLVADIVQRFGRGLLARLIARLVEIAQLPARLLAAAGVAAPTTELASGSGLSAIETARGRLVHYVELVGGRIAKFRILAPTDWNFHPEGALAASLANLRPGPLDEMRRKADLLIETIDPCVGYELRLAHA